MALVCQKTKKWSREIKEETLMNEINAQREYYKTTAHKYDSMHMDIEHKVELSFLSSSIEYFGIESVLDIGSGTGRAISFLKARHPNLILKGIEPVAGLREIGYNKGIGKDDLIDGDAYNLKFKDGEFDLVCECGVLHHVRYPNKVIAEMLRVAKKGIFISDRNRAGGIGWFSQFIRSNLERFGLFNLFVFLRTKGKGYYNTKGDGISYSYSVFHNYKQIKKQCRDIHILNTKGNGINPYNSATHVALLAVK